MHRLASLFRRISTGCLIFFALPASINYQLEGYGVGAGGTGNSSSTNYAANGITGEKSNTSSSSTNYLSQPGLNYQENANTPAAPTLSNGSGTYYNRLLLTIVPDSAPSTTTFAVAISTDNFSTTNYVQSDGTIGATLGTEDFQTYAAWGSGSGSFITGLTTSTTYYVKVSSYLGMFSQSPYGPVASSATVAQSLTFDIDIAPTDSETSPPYTLALSNLTSGSIITGTDLLWVDFATNATYGGAVYIRSANQALASSSSGGSIASSSVDLSSVSEGYGARIASASQSTGTLVEDALYLDPGGVTFIGALTSAYQSLFTAAAPLGGGRGSVYFKAKSRSVTAAASDYTDTLTVVATASF